MEIKTKKTSNPWETNIFSKNFSTISKFTCIPVSSVHVPSTVENWNWESFFHVSEKKYRLHIQWKQNCCTQLGQKY